MAAVRCLKQRSHVQLNVERASCVQTSPCCPASAPADVKALKKRHASTSTQTGRCTLPRILMLEDFSKHQSYAYEAIEPAVQQLQAESDSYSMACILRD